MPFGFRRGRQGKRRVRRQQGGANKQGLRRKFGINQPENCICPQCHIIIPHKTGIPCFQTRCPQCGAFMTRQFIVPENEE